MPIKITCPPCFSVRMIAIIGVTFAMLALQSTLIPHQAQQLHAVSPGQIDQMRRIITFPEQNNECTVTTYEVQPGDTINSVAGKAGTTTQRVRDCNGLSSDTIYAGQNLNLPGEVNNNQNNNPNVRVTRAYRPTPQPGNQYYQNSNNGNGSAYNGQRNSRPPRRGP